MVGAKDALVAVLSEKSSSQIRILAPSEEMARRVRKACPWADAPIDPTNMLELVRTHGKGLLSAKHRAQLIAGETNKIVRSAIRRDYSGIGLFPKTDDPYYFLSDFVMDLRAFEPKLPEGASLITADVRGHEDKLFGLYFLLRKYGSPVLSGAPFHTMLATRRTKIQIGVLGWISLSVVLLIGFSLFRGFRFVLPIVLALGAGYLVASAAVLLLPGRPHALTFLFGTTLIGLGVDYCYHAMSGEASSDRSRFVRSLTQALVTTCLAFAPLAFSSVAVLRQMSVFTISGLVAIYASVVLWGTGCKTQPGKVGTDPREMGTVPAKRTGRLFWLRVLAFVLAAAGVMRLSFGNDPESFYKMPGRLADDEAKVATALGCADARLALVDLEAWQRENAALKAKMGIEPKGAFLTAADLPRELTLSHNGTDYLVVPGSFIWGQTPVEKRGQSPEKWGQSLSVLRVIDTKSEICCLFESLASDTNRLLVVSFALMAIILVILFRGRVLSYAVPIAASVVATAGVLGWMGMKVSFFHLICFFILVGVGIDYVIFHRAGGSDKIVRASFLTSFVGFGALALTSFPVTRGMGVALSAGLFFSYILSLPSARQERELSATNWHDQPERAAGLIRMWAIFLTYRIFGKSFTKFVTFFIILCVYPWAKPVRDALMKFARLVGTVPSKKGTVPNGTFAFKVMLNFSWAMVDKMDACCFMKNLPKMTVKGDKEWMRGGCFLLSTHVGCVEVLPALGKEFREEGSVPHVHAFQQMGRDVLYTSFFMRYLDRPKLTLHAIEDIGVETAVEMKEAISHGEIVIMAGDRLPVGKSRTAALKHQFLGVECEFPKGTFRFARLMECPVYAISCVRIGWNAYEVEAKMLRDGALNEGTVPAGRESRDDGLLGEYVSFLESAARRRPEQWFQFYDFFGRI